MLHWNFIEHVAIIPPGRLPVVFGHDGFLQNSHYIYMYYEENTRLYLLFIQLRRVTRQYTNNLDICYK